MSPVVARPDGGRVCLLALATSGDWCSVALHRHDAGVDESECLSERLGAGQSERILAMVRTVCGDAGVGLGEIDAIAFDAGPGSFTSLRVGCSVAQGLGFALERPVLPVAAPAALGWQRLRASRRVAGDVLVAVDARMDELYVAMYRLRLDAPANWGQTLIEPRLLARAGFVSELAACWPAAGAGVGEHPVAAEPLPAQVLPGGNAWRSLGLLDEWKARHGLASVPAAPASEQAYVRADALAEIALRDWHAGRAIDASEAAPRYVRDKVALDRDEQRALRLRRAQRTGARADR